MMQTLQVIDPAFAKNATVKGFLDRSGAKGALRVDVRKRAGWRRLIRST